MNSKDINIFRQEKQRSDYIITPHHGDEGVSYSSINTSLLKKITHSPFMCFSYLTYQLSYLSGTFLCHEISEIKQSSHYPEAARFSPYPLT